MKTMKKKEYQAQVKENNSKKIEIIDLKEEEVVLTIAKGIDKAL